MPLVYAGICSHAPGITGRAERADPALRDPFCQHLRDRGDERRAGRPDAMLVVAAEHFANFFMDNMPAYCMGMADYYDGPIEDPQWLGIEPQRVPGAASLAERLIGRMMARIDLAYAQEWKFDHGIAVPLHFLTPRYDLPVIPVNINCQEPPLTPLHRVWAFGKALRKACDAMPERVALVGTGGISHWPCTPDSGTINEAFDRDFLIKFVNNRKDELLAYTDEEVYRDAGHGGFEIRTFISIAAATEGATGNLWFYAPIPIFAVGCTVATMTVQ